MLLVNVFIAGLCVMAVEMTAFRLLAPYFGTTQILITNVIGTIMVALAAGYWIGGRLGDRYPFRRGVCCLLLIAAVLTGCIPLVSRPILHWAGRAVSSQQMGGFVASLGATVFLFMLPLAILGMVSPYAIRVAARDRETVGSTAGRTYAIGTLGSILGTYLPTLLFIPWIGTRATIFVFSGLMLITGGIGLLTTRRGAIASVVALLFVMRIGYGGLGPVKTGPGAVEETESLYNYIQVARRGGRTVLFLNEGYGCHSIFDRDNVLVGGVWDKFLALPAMSGAEGKELDVCIIGLAAGTVANQLSHYWGEGLHIDGVEIDPRIVDMADKHFALDRMHLDVHLEDGRTFLARTERKYDVVIIDAYKQPYIPFHLTTREFFEDVGRHLKPGGVVGINVAVFRKDSEFLSLVIDTMASVFPFLYRCDIDNRDVSFSNIVVVAGHARPHVRGLSAAFPDAPEALLTWVEQRLKPIVGREHPRVLTDDWAPIEWYVDKTLFAFFDDG